MISVTVATLIILFMLIAWKVHSENFMDAVTAIPINSHRRVYLHYTNWCGYCKRMKPIWEGVKINLASSGVEFIENDEDKKRTTGVSGYPTILMLDEFGSRHQYKGGADFDKLRRWVIAANPEMI